MIRTVLCALVVCLATPAAAQYARDPKQPIDEAYTAKMKEYTTAPHFTSPLVDYLPASKGVPTPKDMLGDVAGAPGRLPYSKEVYTYLRMVERSSPRVKVYHRQDRGRARDGRGRGVVGGEPREARGEPGEAGKAGGSRARSR